MIDILFWIALGVIGYFLIGKSGASEKLSQKVKEALEGATKFLTYIFMVLLFFFIAGMLYGIYIVGEGVTSFYFWAPIILFFLLVIYYYT